MLYNNCTECHFVISVYVVDQLPLDELQRISVDIQNIWYKVGLELGLDQIKLNALKDDHPTKACFHMLTKWKKASKKISKSELYQAIEKCQATKGIGLLNMVI